MSHATAGRAPSLRVRLMLNTAIAVTLVLIIAAIMLYSLMRRALLAEFDRALIAEGHAITTIVEFSERGVHVDADLAATLERDPQDRHAAYVIRSGDAILAHSPSVNAEAPPAWATIAANGKPASVSAVDHGPHGRAVALSFVPHTDDEEDKTRAKPPTLVVVVERETHTLDAVLRDIAVSLASVWLVATGVLLGLTGWVITRGLRPVNHLADQIERVGETNLAERIDADALPSELGPIAARINAMLGRLANAFERERGFTADAAHELRTPLAGLQVALEVSASKPRDADAYRKTMRDCLDVVLNMRSMVDGLLFLARADAQSVPLQQAEVSLADLVQRSWQPLGATAAARGVAVTWNLDRAIVLSTDVEKLKQIIVNLLDNAVRYVDERGTIDIASGVEKQHIWLTVANTGSRLAAEDVERVFDRFWRGDTSRTSDGRSYGLGLAISRKLVDALGGTIGATSTPSGDFRIRLTLPPRMPSRDRSR